MILLAGQNESIIPVLGGVVVFVVMGAFALVLFRGYERLARRSLLRKYAGLEVHDVPVAGDVTLTYHTYHGLVAWVTQTPHRVALPPDQARILLGRLLRFNLTWGLLTCGALFIPLTVWNYFAQRRSIDLQESGNAVAEVRAPTAPADGTQNPYASPCAAAVPGGPSRSLFRPVVGWICAALCGVFAITTVVCLIRAEFEPVIGGLLATALLGWTAWDWIGPNRPPSQDP